jgi:hypothetical protein
MAKKKTTSYKRFAPHVGKAKILIFDIETAPIVAHVWKLWDNNVGLNQMVTDWHVMGWSAKWLDAPEDEIMYMDQRNAKNVEDDKVILKELWHLLNEADGVITQNGRNFDQRKVQARFLINDFDPNSTYQHCDVKIESQRLFGFPSHKLEYMTDKINKKYKKLKHNKFPGHELWVECLKGNKEAWDEMELYNKHDVLSLEEFFQRIAPWGVRLNLNVFHDDVDYVCLCGGKEHTKDGFYHTKLGKFQRYRCKKCGHPVRDRINLFSKEKRDSLLQEVPR